MLKKFEVENFKNFQNNTVFDLSSKYNYEFNSEVISQANKCITKGIIYGINGAGKSNLGLAIFDIISHLSDRQLNDIKYTPYLNLQSPKSYATFKYYFSFEENEVVYTYKKQSLYELLEESLVINGEEVIYYDYERNKGFSKLKGSENLVLDNTLSTSNSRIKYLLNTALLTDDETNKAFINFGKFVNTMLLFYSIEGNGYQGFSNGMETISDGIIKRGKLKEFESFLRSNDIDYKLAELTINGGKAIGCTFGDKIVDFFAIASTGTKSLALFFYWFIQMEAASFVYIDEFDAFYHFALSRNIVGNLKELTDVQIILTTHNTDIMSNDILRPDCYFEIKDKVTPLADLTDKDLRKAHNLQKMYKAGAFNE